MKLLGAEVVPVTSGSGTLKDAMNEALRDWVTNVRHTFYCIGTVAGPHPYPAMVRDFQSIIGTREARSRWRRGPPARHAGRLHRRRVERDGPVPSVPRRSCGRIIGGVEAGGHGVDDRMRACRLADRQAARRAARQPDLSAAGRRRADPRGHSRSRPGSTIPASARNMPGCTISAGSSMSASPMPRRWRRSSSAA